MLLFTRRVLQALALLALTASASAQAASALRFAENHKQWGEPVRFRAEIPGGSVFLTSGGFVYDWRSAADLNRAHQAAEAAGRTHHPAADLSIHGHAVFVDFVGASSGAAPVGQRRQAAYHNYFLGNDPARWASHVALFEEVRYAGLYPGTDLRVYSTEAGSFKYDFEVKPGGRPGAIALRYRGADGLRLQPDGTLLVRTSVTDVVEQRPYAYQLLGGRRRTVPCRYRLSGSIVGYEFPQGYDATQPLIIDPVVKACSYSGGSGETWGAATGYDAAGNIYTAALAQTAGYPTTPGAYQVAFQNIQDMAISKLDPAGSRLLYATYLGGSGADVARALRASNSGELYVLAETSSANFPVKAGCFDASANGGPDVTVTHFNAGGTALLGSTYLGGSSQDVAGELVLTSSGGVVVAGNTTSLNFPTSATAYDRTLGGQDAFVANLNSTMTTLQWSTLLGGTSPEQATGLRLEPGGTVLVAGNTISADFPTTPGALRTAYTAPGDGFVARLKADGSGLLASTFFGALNGMDNVTHVAVDSNGAVLLCGTTQGTLTATAGALAGTSGVFVARLSATLASQQLLARPVSSPSFLVTAFGIDPCDNMHIAGFESGFGLPLVNALPNGSNGGFYTTTLNAAGSTRLFGSYFGPAGQHAHSNSHRFDELGRLYQSVCTTNSFPTTATAYAPTRRNSSFDVVMFKIDQSTSGGALVQAAVAAVDSVCAPARVVFSNTSTGTSNFLWNFADNTPLSTEQNPVHVFQNPGTYRVRLVALGTGIGCSRNDTSYVTVRVKARPTVSVPRNLVLCPGGSLTLTASPSAGTTTRWNTGATTAAITVTQPGKYTATVSNGSCTARDSTTVTLAPSPGLPQDTTGCLAGGVQLTARAAPGSTYLWSTQATTPSILVTESGRYTVRVTQNNCTEEKTVNVTLRRPILPPTVITPNGDDKNDYFVPAKDVLEPGTRLRLYNRWGRQIYTTDDYRNDWNAASQPAGVYYYTLENERFCTPYAKGWVEVVK